MASRYDVMQSGTKGSWNVYDNLAQDYVRVRNKNGVLARLEFRTSRAAKKFTEKLIKEDSGGSNRTATTGGAYTSFTTGKVTVHTGNTASDAAPEAASLTIEDETQPIIAHRAATVRFDPGTGFTFASLGGLAFKVDDEAKCTQIPSHKAPEQHCTCGFYAVPTDMKAWDKGNTVDLLVELSGIVCICEGGFRSQYQKILELRLAPCVFCRKPPELTLWDSSGMYLSSSCDKHRINLTGWSEFVVLEKAELEQFCQVPVTVDPMPHQQQRGGMS